MTHHGYDIPPLAGCPLAIAWPEAQLPLAAVVGAVLLLPAVDSLVRVGVFVRQSPLRTPRGHAPIPRESAFS